MRVAFLVPALDDVGGVERSVITQANALVVAGHDVQVVCVERHSEELPHRIDPAVAVDHLVDLRDPDAPRTAGVADDLAPRLATSPSVLVPPRWGPGLTALDDVALHHALPRLDADVVVTVTPALLAAAVQLLHDRCAVVHQEHGAPSEDDAALEPLLAFGPRADVIAVLTRRMAEWIAGQLGQLAPEVVVVPNPIAHGYTPRSTLETKIILSAGRLTADKGFPKLVRAFGEIADEVPDWRLRILGDGGMRIQLVRWIRRLGLYDRVELPGWSQDMPSEWARASVAALGSRNDSPPLVVPEAMAAGLPVVAFDDAFGTRELVRHEVDGLLVGSDSISALAGALLRMTTDDDLRHRLGSAALEASRPWAPERVAERWAGIFESAARRRAGGASRLVRRIQEVPDRAVHRAPEGELPATLSPQAARSLALSWAVSCARETGDFWFVEPPHDQLTPVLVLPMQARDRFLTALGGDGAPTELCLVDTSGPLWLEQRGPVHELARALLGVPTARVSIEPWPTQQGVPNLLSQGCRVDVEFWQPRPDGQLVAPRNGRYTRTVAPDAELVPERVEGVEVRTLALMARPTVRDCTFPIDVVYTWVDGSDPAWNAAREARLAEATGIAHTRASSGQARFVSRDELRYSLRSVHLFAPWVRTIHLVTAGQVPSWLAEHPQVRLVDHSEILPADALPIFNSHAIESCLHRIEGLAEHFIYLNDDFLLGRPLRPQTFFTAAGQPKVFLSAHNLGLDGAPDPAPWLSAAQNNRRLLQDAFGVTTTNSLMHAPYAHRRSVLAELEDRFSEEVARTSRSPFRADTDISMLSSLAQHYGLVTGAAVLGEAESAYIDISSSQLPWRLNRLMDREQDFICLGDHHDHTLQPEVMDRMLAQFFTSYYPVPAPWERPSA